MMISIVFTALLLTAANASSCKANPSVVYFKVGKIIAQVTSAGQFITDPSLFNVQTKAVEMAYDLLHVETSPLTLQFNTVLLHMPTGKRVLIDAGMFNTGVEAFDRSAGRLIPNLRASGVTPESVDVILLTHGHADHASGLIDRKGAVAYPNAHLYVPRVDHHFWTAQPFKNTSPTVSDEDAMLQRDIYVRSIAPYVRNGRLTTVPNRGSPIAGVKFFLTPGNTPGHSRIEVTSAGQRLVVAGDTWLSQADQLRHPEWSHVFEILPQRSFESRLKLLTKLAKSGDLVVAYHEAFPGLGRIVRSATGFDWVPARREKMETVGSICPAM